MGEYVSFRGNGEVLEKIIQEEKDKGKRIVLTGGTFDILHRGHLYFLYKCKEYGDVLVVNIVNDSRVRIHKGLKKPVLGQQDRASLMSALGMTDYVTVHPYIGRNIEDIGPTMRIAKIIKPDVIVQEAGRLEIPGYLEKIKRFLGDVEIDFKSVQRYRGDSEISSSQITERIKQLYVDEISDRIRGALRKRFGGNVSGKNLDILIERILDEYPEEETVLNRF